MFVLARHRPHSARGDGRSDPLSSSSMVASDSRFLTRCIVHELERARAHRAMTPREIHETCPPSNSAIGSERCRTAGISSPCEERRPIRHGRCVCSSAMPPAASMTSSRGSPDNGSLSGSASNSSSKIALAPAAISPPKWSCGQIPMAIRCLKPPPRTRGTRRSIRI